MSQAVNSVFRIRVILIRTKHKFVNKNYLTPHPFLCMIIRQVIHMEKILEQTLLYDFYGELLTDHQKQIYEDVVFHDYSFSEVASEQGISRQGVHDLIKRCNKILQEYESKLHLVERFLAIKSRIETMEASLRNAGEPDREELIEQLNRILENL